MEWYATGGNMPAGMFVDKGSNRTGTNISNNGIRTDKTDEKSKEKTDKDNKKESYDNYPPLVEKANEEVGVTECGKGCNEERITEYHETTKGENNKEETAWCSSFVNWALKQVGIEGTDS